MGYLIQADYIRQIQDVNLQQIITNNAAVLSGAELAAQAEALGYLRQRYDVSFEFQDTAVWNRSMPYSAGNRVYLNADTYVPANTYNTYALTLYTGTIYQANQDGITGAWDASKWDALNPQYTIYNAALPYKEFDVYATYLVGDQVYYKNKTYTCLIQTRTPSHDALIQYGQYDNVPLNNVFPDDRANGAIYWKYDGAYIVPGGTDIDLANYWTQSDSRDQQMVMHLVDIVLYHIHCRITPRNVPQMRIDRYDAAIAWLKAAMKGDILAALPVLQPKQGGRIRWGSEIKKINTY